MYKIAQFIRHFATGLFIAIIYALFLAICVAAIALPIGGIIYLINAIFN